MNIKSVSVVLRYFFFGEKEWLRDWVGWGLVAVEMVEVETLLTGELTGVLRPGEQRTSLRTTGGSTDTIVTNTGTYLL